MVVPNIVNYLINCYSEFPAIKPYIPNEVHKHLNINNPRCLLEVLPSRNCCVEYKLVNFLKHLRRLPRVWLAMDSTQKRKISDSVRT